MLLNEKINDTYKKDLWSEAVNECEFVRNIMAAAGSTTSPFETFMEKNRRSLVHSLSLDVSPPSINISNLRSR